MDIAEFLLARIGEDEALLHRDDREPHSAHLNDLVGTDRADICPTCRGITLLGQKRALAECEAKRRIVQRMADLGAHFADTGRQMPDMRSALLVDGISADLALPYADHPEYRPEWSPAN